MFITNVFRRRVAVPERQDEHGEGHSNTEKAQQPPGPDDREQVQYSPAEVLQLAVRLVEADRVFRQARANLAYNEESKGLVEAAIDAHNADVERFEAHDRVANGLSIAMARRRIGDHEETLGLWRHDVAVAEHQVAAVKEGRNELIGRFAGLFVDGAETPDAVVECLSEETLEAIGRCVETQEQLEDARARCDVIYEREDRVRARLVQLGEQHDIDAQLEQNDRANTDLVGKRMAKDRGAIQAIETQLEVLGRDIDSLRAERDDADEGLCAMLDEAMVTANLLEADPRPSRAGAETIGARVCRD
ncbi:hypothetical protein LTR85_002594 [Meristemomyces frigidus]|nr:hypothetical protein LTR85_002594 [Meristemomyces frigidus]